MRSDYIIDKSYRWLGMLKRNAANSLSLTRVGREFVVLHASYLRLNLSGEILTENYQESGRANSVVFGIYDVNC